MVGKLRAFRLGDIPAPRKMLSLQEFQQWNLRQTWNQTTIGVIADIRAAPPTRRVKSRAGNVRAIAHVS